MISNPREAIDTMQARGSFDVQLNPQPLAEDADQSGLNRLSINKVFHGDLEAISVGEMLSAGTAVEGSAGYVAMERVTGRLNGRSGSFYFQHSASMRRGAPALSISVVPDSGTDELVGLTGQMQIDISDGKHAYVFDYAIE